MGINTDHCICIATDADMALDFPMALVARLVTHNRLFLSTLQSPCLFLFNNAHCASKHTVVTPAAF